MRCGYEVQNYFIACIPVFLQVTERGTFEVPPLSNYALTPMMLPLVETFLVVE
jgi:hypothetical protein